MNQQRLFHRDFVLVVVGQIISLFGNGIIRFALPLYLLDTTGSSALFGIVSASAFLPMIILTPMGGIIADRVNKRNIMVVLDFSTAALIGGFTLLLGRVDLVVLLIVTLMLLYGIQGAYQPAVQASMPLLATRDNLLAANAVINQVSALSGLISPILGGVLYGIWGLRPILFAGIACFFISAVMEIFIRMPPAPKREAQGVFAIVCGDLRESFTFIVRERPMICKALCVVLALNLFLSALLVVGLPVLITQTLSLSKELYGLAQGICAAGSLLGGVLLGVFSKRLRLQRVHILLAASAVMLFPVGIFLFLGVSAIVQYWIITIFTFFTMIFATMFSIQMLTFMQMETPPHLTGKVISCALALAMCSQPVGQAMYGLLFEFLPAGAVVLAGAIISAIIALFSHRVFHGLDAERSGKSLP